MSVRQATILDRDVDLEMWVARVAGIVLFFLLWTYLASIYPENLMPTPYGTVEVAWTMVQEGIVLPHLTATLLRVFIAFIVAMLAGVTIGVLMGTSGFMRNFMTPYVMFTLSLPGVAVVLINVLIFGFTEITIVLTAVAITFPYVVINMMEGVEDIDHNLLEMSGAFDISRRRLLRRVVLPDVAPALFSSARFSISIGWRLVVTAEAFGGGTGIGYKLLQSFEGYQFTRSWGWALIFMAVIIVIEYVFLKPIERRVFDYRDDVGFAVAG